MRPRLIARTTRGRNRLAIGLQPNAPTPADTRWHSTCPVRGYAWHDLRRAGTTRRPDDAVAVAFRRARLHGGVWASYLGGGVLGAFLALHWDLWSLTLSLAALGVLIVVDVARRA
jgi:hypothetical protein